MKKYFLLITLIYLPYISCVSFVPNKQEKLPQDIQISSEIIEEGKFVYNKNKFRNEKFENTIFISGKLGKQKNNFKDRIFNSEVEKRSWKSQIQFNNEVFNIDVKFDVQANDEEYKKYEIELISFEENYIEIPDRIDTNDVEIPYMISRIHNEYGVCYKVFVVERARFCPKNSKYIVLDKNQEFSILLENTLVATFDSKRYKIYSKDNLVLLKKYVAILNSIFEGIQKYEKGFYFS